MIQQHFVYIEMSDELGSNGSGLSVSNLLIKRAYLKMLYLMGVIING